MYWTRRLSPDLRCSSIHWVRVPGTSTVPAPPLLAVLAARPWPRATVRFAVRCTSCATPAAIFFSVPLTRQILQPIGISRREWRLTSWLASVLHKLWSVLCIHALYTVWHVVRFYLGNHSNMPNRTDYHAFQERVRPRDGAVLSNCWQIYVFAYSFATCKWVLFTLCAHCFPNPLKDFRNI